MLLLGVLKSIDAPLYMLHIFLFILCVGVSTNNEQQIFLLFFTSLFTVSGVDDFESLFDT